MMKKIKLAPHFPIINEAALIGADIRVSKVPNLLSSAIDLIVRKGIRAGDPKIRPTLRQDNGGKIQFVE